ncbi:hypothetical protein SAMN05216360_101538 [Methylobacterium phyllostachyos]|uniref:Uncharacterized protein n=1 Tax=Methylobacterium phyllostachyos TaxID=582672 RepID=A0A1G9SAI6_9HYPH|nr:hypothetical protein [Methylobacterium phyllostachyos]SDM31795.1 hypothetical protein SAMN05216360_101538 [Methylobacterium phyllostachyos]
MAKRRPNPDQLDFFSLPALVPAAAPSAFLFHRPGCVEEAEAIAAIPFGQRWENYVAVGAAPERIEILLPRKNRIELSITGTRLGWTAGYHLTFRRPVGPGANPKAETGCFGQACGGGLHANVDECGFFLWMSRDAALRTAAHRAWWACWKLDEKIASEVERAMEKVFGFSPVQAPGHDARRWLVSRADGDASLERRRSGPHEDVPESPAIDEYRRAAGLSDISAWRAAA